MKVQSLHHVSLHVADLPRSIDFYARVLKLEQLERPGSPQEGAWFRVGPSQQLHLISRPPAEAPYTPPRERHFALTVADLPSSLAHLEQCGIEFEPPRRHPGGALQVYLRDPDSHQIELTDAGSSSSHSS